MAMSAPVAAPAVMLRAKAPIPAFGKQARAGAAARGPLRCSATQSGKGSNKKGVTIGGKIQPKLSFKDSGASGSTKKKAPPAAKPEPPKKAAPVPKPAAKEAPAAAAPKEEPAPPATPPPAATSTPVDGVIYVGKGRFVKDDERKYPSKTTLTGGWAGGEVGLQGFRENARQEVAEKKAKAAEEKAKVIYNTKTGEVVDIDMSKDFGAMAGGWPGGEKGVMMYAQSGEVIENKKPPTLGWGPAILAALVAGAYGYYVYEQDPVVEIEQVDSTSGEVKTVQVKSLTVKKEPAPTPAATKVALKVAPYAALAAGVGVGAVVAINSTKKVLGKAGEAAKKSAPVALLATATAAVAAKIVGVL